MRFRKEEEMSNYSFRKAEKKDIVSILKIYNSNTSFLKNHLGSAKVDERFIENELTEMEKMNFLSSVIVSNDTEQVIGVIDYKADDTVYLSLIMLDAELQRQGIGKKLYNQFEKEMKTIGKDKIRIDVVNDYNNNVIPFWEKQGFISQETIVLEWGNKKSPAIVMTKKLGEQSN